MKTARIVFKCKECELIRGVDVMVLYKLSSTTNRQEKGYYIKGHPLYAHSHLFTCCGTPMETKMITPEIEVESPIRKGVYL